jgi:hypothetical protein
MFGIFIFRWNNLLGRIFYVRNIHKSDGKIKQWVGKLLCLLVPVEPLGTIGVINFYRTPVVNEETW